MAKLFMTFYKICHMHRIINVFLVAFIMITCILKYGWFHYICRHHSKNKNGNGMPASLLQRVHRQIHALRVCPQTINIIISQFCSWDGIGFFFFWQKDGIGLLAVNFCFFHFLLSLDWFYCSNNECPACRTHCASRRSLRDDPNYDALIAAIYPDIDKYEEEVRCTYCMLDKKCILAEKSH